MTMFDLRLYLPAILLVALVGCAGLSQVACNEFVDPDLLATDVAVVRPATAALEAIDGNRVPVGRDPEHFACREAHLDPGRYTLTLNSWLPVSVEDDPTGYVKLKRRLTFDAEAGHDYELHFDRNYERHAQIFWWIEDTTRRQVVAGMPLD